MAIAPVAQTTVAEALAYVAQLQERRDAAERARDERAAALAAQRLAVAQTILERVLKRTYTQTAP